MKQEHFTETQQQIIPLRSGRSFDEPCLTLYRFICQVAAKRGLPPLAISGPRSRTAQQNHEAPAPQDPQSPGLQLQFAFKKLLACTRRHFPMGRKYQEFMFPHRKQSSSKVEVRIAFLTQLEHRTVIRPTDSRKSHTRRLKIRCSCNGLLSRIFRVAIGSFQYNPQRKGTAVRSSLKMTVPTADGRSQAALTVVFQSYFVCMMRTKLIKFPQRERRP